MIVAVNFKIVLRNMLAPLKFIYKLISSVVVLVLADVCKLL